MPIEKPKKPTELIPRAFGGIKNNFSDDLQSTGFEPNIPQTYNGDNLNYHLDATGKELDYVEKVVDFINQAPVNHIPFVNENNQLDYVDASSLGSGAFDMFDTKIADHILTGNEAKGWALQGTYVTKESYPDFYNICLEQKNAATETQTTLGDGALTMFINQNGHQFYNITDKPIIDAFYSVYGIADFYGIDEVNERVFLPRNKWFAITGVAPVVGNGTALGLTIDKIDTFYMHSGQDWNGSDPNNNSTPKWHSENGQLPYSAETTYVRFGSGNTSAIGITIDPTKSGVEAKLTPNENKYLYYCVGNTQVTSAITNVTELTSTENDTIPLFTGMYFDFKPNNPSWLKAGEQQNSAGIYKACYETLVEIVNGINNCDLKVINEADIVNGVDYSEYWVLDQDNLTFRTPLTIATKSLSGGVVGNGMTLGLTDGILNAGLSKVGNTYELRPYQNIYGEALGAIGSGNGLGSGAYGITLDPTKSGIIAEQSSARLYFKVANAVQNLELLDAGEVLEGLAQKVDKANTEWATSACMPDYSATIVPTSPFVAPCNGYLFALFGSGQDLTMTITQPDGKSHTFERLGTYGNDMSNIFYPIAKGCTVVSNFPNLKYFYPCIGG